MTTTSISATPRRLSLLFAIMLVVAACGTASDSDRTEQSSAPPPTEAPVAADTTRPEDPVPADAPDDHDDAAPHDDDAADDDEVAHDDTEAPHDDDAAHDDDSADRVVEVSMTEMAFTPETVDVTAGETITFIVSNDGTVVHELRLSNAHRIEEHLASGHDDHGDDDGHHGEADVVLELEPGEEGELTVTFPEDVTFFTEIACLIPGHYEAGMKGSLTYQ